MGYSSNNYKILYLIVSLSSLPCCLNGQRFDAVVSSHGTGNYTRIMDAIAAAPSNRHIKFRIHITGGSYEENVQIPADKTNLALVGDGLDQTIILGRRSVSNTITTYDTATVGVQGQGFLAIGISFENVAGPGKGQAVALRSDVDSVFYRCRFAGYQDTLYAREGRQFYRECEIYGTVDFIFGNAAVIFQNCHIFTRKPARGQVNTITAQGRTDPKGVQGTVIHNCTIQAAADFLPYKSSTKSYLGRPWKTYSRVVILQSFIDDVIDPRGWLEWNGETTNLGTLYYAEFEDRGPGKATGNRVSWPGFKNLANRVDANAFTVRNFIQGHRWIPSTGVPFILDLI